MMPINNETFIVSRRLFDLVLIWVTFNCLENFQEQFNASVVPNGHLLILITISIHNVEAPVSNIE